MDHATVTEIIVGSFGAVFLALLAVVGFFSSRQIRSTDKLTEAVNGLTTTIAVQAEKIDRHEDDIAALKGQACQNPDCPYRGDRWRSN